MKEGSKRGRAVIMSFKYFVDAKLKDRQGNDADVVNLKKILESLQFTVETADNQSHKVRYVLSVIY